MTSIQAGAYMKDATVSSAQIFRFRRKNDIKHSLLKYTRELPDFHHLAAAQSESILLHLKEDKWYIKFTLGAHFLSLNIHLI